MQLETYKLAKNLVWRNSMANTAYALSLSVGMTFQYMKLKWALHLRYSFFLPLHSAHCMCISWIPYSPKKMKIWFVYSTSFGPHSNRNFFDKPVTKVIYAYSSEPCELIALHLNPLQSMHNFKVKTSCSLYIKYEIMMYDFSIVLSIWYDILSLINRIKLSSSEQPTHPYQSLVELCFFLCLFHL